MPSSRILTNKFPTTFSFFTSSSSTLNYRHLTPSQHRLISSTSQLHNSWVDKIKGAFTGQKQKTTTGPEGGPQISSEAFTLLRESPTSLPCHSKAVLLFAQLKCLFFLCFPLLLIFVHTLLLFWCKMGILGFISFKFCIFAIFFNPLVIIGYSFSCSFYIFGCQICCCSS